MSGLAAVLAAHLWHDRKGQTCGCGWDYERGNGVPRLDQYTAHVAAAVLAWIEERLASDEMREAVAVAIKRGNVGNERSIAALTAVTAALRGQAC